MNRLLTFTFFFNLNRINSIYNFNTRFNMWTIPYNPLHSPISDNFSFQFSEIQQNLLYLNSLGGHTWYNILRQSSVISPNQLQLFENMWTELKKKLQWRKTCKQLNVTYFYIVSGVETLYGCVYGGWGGCGEKVKKECWSHDLNAWF